MVDAQIYGLNRGTLLSDENFHREAHTVATAADPNPTVSRDETIVYNLLIDHPDGTILWDTGSHPDAGNGYWPDWLYNAFEHPDAHEHPLPDCLNEHGFGIDDIDYVLQTHLHMDHAGGLEHFAGTGTPILVHEEELKFAYYSVVTQDGSAGYHRPDFDRDLNWHVIHTDHTHPFEDIELFRLEGHTPGLLATLIHLDRYGSVLFTSDLVEVADNYADEHPAGPGILWDRNNWRASIHALKDLARKHDADVIYGHEPSQLETITAGWP